jgi:hypothetical protein
MLNIDKNTGALVAAETKGTLKAIDDAILTELRLCTTLVEAFDTTNMPVKSSQKLLQSLASGLNHFVAGRADMAHTISTLTSIKSDSNLQETSYNCPGHPPVLNSLEAIDTLQACPATTFG